MGAVPAAKILTVGWNVRWSLYGGSVSDLCCCFFTLHVLGEISVALQLGPEGSAALPAAGRSDEAFRQLEERRQRHQEPPLVSVDRLDRHLPEEGTRGRIAGSIPFFRSFLRH